MLCLVALVVLVVGSKVLNQAPWMAGPDQVNACGRRYYDAHVSPVGREEALHDSPTLVGHVSTWAGSRRVWGELRATNCGPGVYVETAPDEFRGYRLSGGP